MSTLLPFLNPDILPAGLAPKPVHIADPNPFSGQRLACVPAHRPDVTIIHAQKADRSGNVLVEGIVGVQKEAVLAARRSLVTVEEIVDEIGPRSPNAVILPSWNSSRGCASVLHAWLLFA